jgi:rhodanese-related sulfurtransferase
LDTVLERGKKALSAREFELVANETNALILDTRDPAIFAQGFIPNAINIGLEGSFAMWVGEMIPDIKQEILLVTEAGKEEEAMIRLSRVGYDFTIGYLNGGFEAWKNSGMEVDSVDRMSAKELDSVYSKDLFIVDVRKKSEFDSEHIVNALNIPLNELANRTTELPSNTNFIVHCAGGYRSMIAASMLKARGINNFKDVIGGMTDILKTDTPRTAYVCPTTLL